jgi:hypothetical protein
MIGPPAQTRGSDYTATLTSPAPVVLGRHTVPEVLAGAVLGALVSIALSIVLIGL